MNTKEKNKELQNEMVHSFDNKKKTFDDKVKRGINLFKENLSIIILIPSILGGLLQLMALTNISPEYIRFFSLTQVIPDGLFVLVILVSTYGVVLINSFFSSLLPYIKPDEKNSIKTFFLAHLVMVVFCFLSGSVIFYYAVFKNYDSGLLYKVLISNLCVILILLAFNSLMNILTYLITYFNLFKIKEKTERKTIHTINLVFVTICIGALFTSFKTQNKLQFVNLDLTTHNFKENLNLKKPPKLLYFNDKYLFYEYQTQSETLFETKNFIIPFDKALEIEIQSIIKKEGLTLTDSLILLMKQKEELININESKILKTKLTLDNFIHSKSYDEAKILGDTISQILNKYDSHKGFIYQTKWHQLELSKLKMIVNKKPSTIIDDDIMNVVNWIEELEENELINQYNKIHIYN